MPGITYPDEFGLQVRINVDGERHQAYYAYSRYRGDAMAAHRAARRWYCKMVRKRRRFPWNKGLPRSKWPNGYGKKACS